VRWGKDRSSFTTGGASLHDDVLRDMQAFNPIVLCFNSIDQMSKGYMHSPFLYLIPPEMSDLILLHIPRQHSI
jgi:hypothetical protein